jgi:hypothetical protein
MKVRGAHSDEVPIAISDDDHDVVGRRAFARAAQEQPGDHHHDDAGTCTRSGWNTWGAVSIRPCTCGFG